MSKCSFIVTTSRNVFAVTMLWHVSATLKILFQILTLQINWKQNKRLKSKLSTSIPSVKVSSFRSNRRYIDVVLNSPFTYHLQSIILVVNAFLMQFPKQNRFNFYVTTSFKRHLTVTMPAQTTIYFTHTIKHQFVSHNCNCVRSIHSFLTILPHRQTKASCFLCADSQLLRYTHYFDLNTLQCCQIYNLCYGFPWLT